MFDFYQMSYEPMSFTRCIQLTPFCCGAFKEISRFHPLTSNSQIGGRRSIIDIILKCAFGVQVWDGGRAPLS